MSKWDKLLHQIKSLDKDVRFDELKKVLEDLGYVMSMPKGGSSHCTFRKPNECSITIPKHQTVKTIYVKIVKDIIEREEKKNEDD